MKLTSTGVADKEDFLLLEELEKKLLVQPHDYDTLLRKALLVYYPFLSTDQAEEIFEFIEKLYPNTYDTIFWHGAMLYIYDAHYEKAIQLLRKAIHVNSNRADAYIILAQVLEMMGNEYQKEMEYLFNQALKIEKYWPNAWDGLINLLIKQKRFNEARQVINEAFKHIPTDYVDSNDIIQERCDVYVSGRFRSNHEQDYLQRFLETIKAEETKELEIKNDKNI